ncbi:DNA-binding response OmpR family regulator [Fontibacillus phaseoli]|uniref:DNA-binding response OmpR family regulator n=1 Tax=Fontibacillus phaseoli TaxID=1416533 RepID=A0A369BPJ1_9BACL|nr:response regulator transcription factor [Fontibacillus phaseoli]RCX23540.1 DNA-binding response OmpR family regulator [Fontibacillus phaseoli]
MKDSVLLVQKKDAAGSQRKILLEQAGFEVTLFGGIEDAVGVLEEEIPGILVLSPEPYSRTVFELLERAGEHLPFPVMVILQKWHTDEVVAALDAGVNEVVGDSVPTEELEARIRSLIRLYRRFADGYLTELTYEDLRIELKGRRAYRGNELIKLTPKEFDLLRYLVKRAEQVCQREDILQEVWGYDFSTGTNVVDVYIRHLRKKIDKGKSRKLIHTVRGTGYLIR